MTGNRVAAILVGLAIMFPLERWGGFQWYSALALGAVGYAVARYIGYFVRERRYIRETTAEALKYSRAQKRDEISN